MQVPFEGFVIPPLPYVAVLLAGTALIGALLYTLRPPVTQRGVLSFTPWIVTGAMLHVFFQLGEAYQRQIYPSLIEPFFSAPAVYLTTFLVMGPIWILASIVGQSVKSTAEGSDYVARYLMIAGTGVLLTFIGLFVWQALDPAVGPLFPLLPIVGLLVTLAVTFVVYILLGTWRTYVIAETRYAGALVLFAHLFDGIITAIGIDLMGASERSVLPRRIMDFAGDLPTAEVLGTGWLFVVVKLLLAVVLLFVFSDYMREEPDRANLLFAAIAAVGLGPAMNNFFLFILGIGM
ncbi:MAG: putative membrane protein [Haloarculaceae archaeon]|jgi:uncharacterized membrane protein